MLGLSVCLRDKNVPVSATVCVYECEGRCVWCVSEHACENMMVCVCVCKRVTVCDNVCVVHIEESQEATARAGATGISGRCDGRT